MPEAPPATPRRLIPVLVAMMLATACGSTVPESARVGGQPVSGVGDTGLGVPTEVAGEEAGVSGGGGLGTGTTGTGTDGGTGAGGTDIDGGGGGGKGGKGGKGTGGTALGPGITDKKIFVAIGYSDAGAANQAAFGTPLDADARKPYTAMIKEINEAGGILGRDVEPIFFEFSAATTARPLDQQSQAACAPWHQDHEVFFMLYVDSSGILQQCTEKAGGVTLGPIGSSLPETYQKFPHYVEIAGMDFVRAGRVTATGLKQSGYFDGAPRIGIVSWDAPDYKAALEQGYLPALQKLGYGLATEPAFVPSPQNVNDLAASSADVNNAVLRFQTQGITHVMILGGESGLCGGSCIETLFLQRAQQQQFFPRYGFNAANNAQTGASAGIYPREQLRRSVVVEWSAGDPLADQGYKVNQPREKCYEIMRKRGVPLGNVNEQGLARFACDQFWFIQAAIGRMGNAPLNSDNFIGGVNKLGSSYPSANAFATNFSAQQHDGIAAARNMSFQDSCNCYQWTTQPYGV